MDFLIILLPKVHKPCNLSSEREQTKVISAVKKGGTYAFATFNAYALAGKGIPALFWTYAIKLCQETP